RKHVERLIAHMFEWRSGQFHFEVQDDLAPQDRALALAAGLSPQYLAMEATRRGDELRAGVPGLEAALVFSGEEESSLPRTGDPHEIVVAATVERWLADSLEADEAPREAALPRAVCSQAVVVDPEFAALEWLKSSLAGSFARIHLFQTAEGAIPRIRQYLRRGGVPAVPPPSPPPARPPSP